MSDGYKCIEMPKFLMPYHNPTHEWYKQNWAIWVNLCIRMDQNKYKSDFLVKINVALYGGSLKRGKW